MNKYTYIENDGKVPELKEMTECKVCGYYSYSETSCEKCEDIAHMKKLEESLWFLKGRYKKSLMKNLETVSYL